MARSGKIGRTALAALLLAGAVGCADDDKGTNGGPVELKYIGAAKCQSCHEEEYAKWASSGHRYKLNKVTNGQQPVYPHGQGLQLPAGKTWSDVTYVIGGYGWKARYLDKDGYIMTGDAVQYNLPRADLGLPNGAMAAYEKELPRKAYTCGECHVTGWQTLAENGGLHQDSLAGIEGTWFETGITCERCHGMGSQHEADPKKSNINITRTSDLCGECHFRDTNHGILASGSSPNQFIQHHEQYDEMISAGHRALLCTYCHDQHTGVYAAKYQPSKPAGIKVECATCHAAEASKNSHVVDVDCEDCHLARAGKSGRSVNIYKGDIRTHIFKITTDPYPKDSMFYVSQTDGKVYARGFMTLDFACYGCHKDASGVGGSASQKTLAELSTRARGIHTASAALANQ
ncbi:MAG: multiheme c-type cytochrome [Candidatus Zixiibacteriota bacterium]